MKSERCERGIWAGPCFFWAIVDVCFSHSHHYVKFSGGTTSSSPAGRPLFFSCSFCLCVCYLIFLRHVCIRCHCALSQIPPPKSQNSLYLLKEHIVLFTEHKILYLSMGKIYYKLGCQAGFVYFTSGLDLRYLMYYYYDVTKV